MKMLCAFFVILVYSSFVISNIALSRIKPVDVLGNSLKYK